MSESSLLSPGRIGDFVTKNRMIMAPMTRSRAGQGGVPSELAIEYYTQRASAGLIITEGVAPSAVGLGYARTPAIETAEQIDAWKAITEAVHAKGGRMFAQFMHVGRIGHPAKPREPAAPRPCDLNLQLCFRRLHSHFGRCGKNQLRHCFR